MGFCPRCGKETEHEFCLACLRELRPLVSKIKTLQAVMCPVCGKMFVKSAWNRKPLQEVVERTLERAIVFQPGARIDQVLVEPLTPEPGKQDVQLTVIGSADADGDAYEEYYTSTILIDGNRCTECERLANTYFTGILQLRRPNDTVMTEIEKQLGTALSGVKDVTGGIDYYATSHHIMQNVARAVHNQYGGELTIRAQHFSYDSLTSKNLYRVNACLRLPKFWKGSLVQAGTKLLYITSMGRQLKGIDIMTGKNMSAPCKNEYDELPVEETTIVTTRPSVTVLDPETYQTIPIANERDEFKQLATGTKVKVARVDESLVIVSTV